MTPPLTEGKVRRKEVLLGVCAKGPLLSSFSQKDKKYFSFEAKNHELTYDIMEDTIIRIENQGKCSSFHFQCSSVLSTSREMES